MSTTMTVGSPSAVKPSSSPAAGAWFSPCSCRCNWLSFGWLWFDSADKLSAQLNQATTELSGLRNRVNAAGSEAELQRLQASTIPGLLPPLIPGSLAQQKAQLSESLDLNRSGLQTNLNRQRTSTVVNSLPGTLRVLLGASIVAAFLFTIKRHFQ
jgi:hypothetical protein